jgi:predicted lipid-binding transport protein (Tim44 family)|tara:strand:- start:15 stop:617 length:603 start_codon:yes stop_codon:yes gene_type:complete
MGQQFGYIDIILLAMFAGFVFLRLRNILGRKTGHQRKTVNKYFPKGMEVLKDIEINEAMKRGEVDEDAKKQFLKGAEAAYEQIITSFAKGDKKSLKPLLAKNTFALFSEAIDARKSKQLKNEITFIGIKSTKVEEFKKIENIYRATVNFVSEIITCVKDKNDKLVEGSPDEIKTVNDVWKFSKNMWSQDPTWYLVDTTND